MSRRNVVSFYTGVARSGKTFRLVVKIVDEILPLTEGVIYTNLPLNVDAIADYCSVKQSVSRETILERLHIVSRVTEEIWRDAGKPLIDSSGKKVGVYPLEGPWEYFADKPLSGATIIIDEIHNFCGSIGTPKTVSNMWQKWLGELGHNQAVFIGVSQAPEKVHACIKQESAAQYSIRNTGLDRDPFFKIEVYDWLELWAGMFNQPYKVFVFEQEVQKIEGRKERGQRQLYRMGPPYFDFYDSFNKPISNEQSEDVKPFEHEYEKHLRKGAVRGRLSLIRWFVWKNFTQFLSRGLMALLLGGLLVYMLLGGAGDVTRMISSSMSKAFSRKNESAVADAPPDYLVNVDLTGIEGDKLAVVRKLYEGELRKVLTENQTVTAELKILKEEIAKQNAVVLVTPNSIVLKRGVAYGIGEEITFGDFKGRKIAAINYRLREAVLDNGDILRLTQ